MSDHPKSKNDAMSSDSNNNDIIINNNNNIIIIINYISIISIILLINNTNYKLGASDWRSLSALDLSATTMVYRYLAVRTLNLVVPTLVLRILTCLTSGRRACSKNDLMSYGCA